MWEKQTWISPGDGTVNLLDIVKSMSGKNVYVGCDSKEKSGSATMVCIFAYDRKYFYTKIKKQPFPDIESRLREEINCALSLAVNLLSLDSTLNIEVHYDISQKSKNLSNKLLKYATSYTESLNLSWKVKPNAWASTDIADWHTK